MHTDQTRHLQLPRLSSEYVYGVGATDTHGYHAQATGIGGVRVGTHHHAAGEGVVLQDHLVDDAGSRSPEANAITRRGRLQEVVHLFISVLRRGQVLAGAYISTNQVVAVDGGRHCNMALASIHKLEDSHLSRRILHGNAVRAEVDIRLSP